MDGSELWETFDLPSEFDHAVNAVAYVWAKGIDTLDPKIWSYQVFIKEKLTWWLGGEGGKSYAWVDAKRARLLLAAAAATSAPQWNGVAEAQVKIIEQEKKDEFVFGRGMRKWFGMDPNYINLNNG